MELSCLSRIRARPRPSALVNALRTSATAVRGRERLEGHNLPRPRIGPLKGVVKNLAELFPRVAKPIIGMLHLPPLPGSYNYAGQPLDDIVAHAVGDADILTSSGFDGLLMQNAGERPAYLEVCPEKIAYMFVLA